MELEAASRVHTRSGRLNSTRQHDEPHRSKSNRYACGPSRMGTYKISILDCSPRVQREDWTALRPREVSKRRKKMVLRTACDRA